MISLGTRSKAAVAPGTGFLKIFPRIGGGAGNGSDGNVSNGEQSGRQMKLHSLARRSPPAAPPGSSQVGDPCSKDSNHGSVPARQEMHPHSTIRRPVNLNNISNTARPSGGKIHPHAVYGEEQKQAQFLRGGTDGTAMASSVYATKTGLQSHPYGERSPSHAAPSPALGSFTFAP